MNIVEIIKAKALRKPLIIAWLLSLTLTISVPVVTGQIYSSAYAKDLVETVQKASLYYGSAIAAASATVLALTLTMLNLTYANRDNPDKVIFTRLHAISAFCVFSFIGAIMLLLVISFPVVEFDKIPSDWFRYAYYAICGWNGVLAGCMMSTILILRDNVAETIGALSPDFDEDGEEQNKK